MIPMATRYKIASAACRRWEKTGVFAREHPEDFAQEIWVAILSRQKRHDTVREIRRYAYRHVYAAANRYYAFGVELTADTAERVRETGSSIQRLPPAVVRRIRKKLGLTQAELAVRLGMSSAQVSRWEHGRTTDPKQRENQKRFKERKANANRSNES